MAFTFQGAAFGKRVLPMVEKLGSRIVEEADVENEESLDRLFAPPEEGLWAGSISWSTPSPSPTRRS